MASKPPPPALYSLPTELLLYISTYLVTAAHLNALLRTSQRFAQLCSPLLFLRALVTVDARNGRSVLHWAAATGHGRLLERLLAVGTNVNTVDNYGTAPLDSAVLLGSEMEVMRLLERGAAVNRMGKDGRTALHLASITGNDIVARLLLQRGADVRALSGEVLEMTPLHYAVMLGHVRVVKVLLEHGATVDTCDVIGRTISQQTAVPGREEMLEMLFGTREEAAAIVPCATVAILVSLVDFLLKRPVRELFVAEERAKVFRCTADRMAQWDLKTPEEIVYCVMCDV